MKKILLITTGGTIASSDEGKGFSPSAGGDELLSHIPEVKNLYDIHILSIMQIDSTNMTPSLMIKIAHTVEEYYEQFDAFVIAHGTDTMAYTASLLSSILKGLNKPIILTGSQIAMGEENSDAPKNMRDAFKMAAEDIAGVYIVFGGRVILGTKAVKTKTHSFEGFESINADYIALSNQGNIEYTDYGKGIKNIPITEPFRCLPKISENVAVIKLSPGMPKEIINSVAQYCDAIIIEAYGMGGVPFTTPNLQEEIKKIQQSGKIVAIASQCLYEPVDLSVYEVGMKMQKTNILSAEDMTTEAVVAKLMWSLGNSKNIEEAEALFLS